jgi:hypothetical protein
VNPFLRTQPAIFDAPPVAEDKPLAPEEDPELKAPLPKAPDWSLDGDGEPPQAGKPN